MLLNSASLAALNVGFRTTFNNAFSGVKPTHEQVATVVPSTQGSEQYGWLGSFPKFREWLGDRVVQNLSTSDFTLKNKTFENTVGVEREKIEDDSYGVYTPIFAQLGEASARHPDELVYSLFPAGFNTACYDGQYFFDTDHPGYNAAGEVISVSNTQAGASAAWYLLCTENAVKPFIFQKRRDYQFTAKTSLTDDNVFHAKEFLYGVDSRVNAGYGLWQLAFGSKATLDATNHDAARAAMGGLRGPGGRPLGVKPNLLVVPPALEGAGLRLLNAEKDANGADNIWRGTAKLLVVNELAA